MYRYFWQAQCQDSLQYQGGIDLYSMKLLTWNPLTLMHFPFYTALNTDVNVIIQKSTTSLEHHYMTCPTPSYDAPVMSCSFWWGMFAHAPG